MNRIQNGKNRNLDKPVPGCLGRMVNLFDLNTGVGGNRLLTDKPHHDGSPLSRSQSDVSRASLVDDQADDKVIACELRKSPSDRKSNGTPIKMLIAQEMSKEDVSKQSPPNLVAKLMGLDALPMQHQPGAASRRSHLRGSRSHSGSLDFSQQEHGFELHQYSEQREYKDVYEIWQQSCKSDYVRDDSPQKGRYSESKTEKKMALVREKFMEAKRLSTDEKLRQSKQFQDALEVLSSNKDLFLKFLQEPNSLFSHHLYGLQSVPPPPDSRRITVLRPSKLVDSHKITGRAKITENHIKEAAPVGRINGWDKRSSGFVESPDCCKIDDNPSQPTRIVVLKPSSGKLHNIKAVVSPPSSSLRTSNDEEFYGDPEDSETLQSKEGKEITSEMCENLSGHRRDETLLSSVFSNGYIGDESSFSKSEIDYAAGNLSDSEVISPTSRHSWDYINRFDSPYSTSSFSRASYSPESSVCREAKKRLSERWAMMAANGSAQEQRHVRRTSSTLGEMLALSDLKKSVKTEEDGKSREEESRGSTSRLINDLNKPEECDNSPRNLLRSKSVPVSFTSSGDRLGMEVSDSLKGKADGPKDLTKEKSVKLSSFKGRVSSLFFSKNKKASKEKSHRSKDEDQSCALPAYSSRNIGNDGSQCTSNAGVEEPLPGPHRSLRNASCHDPSDADAGPKQGVILPEGGFCVKKPENPGNPNENQDQPSPNSVLEPQFEDEENTSKDHSRNAKLNEHGIEPLKYNLIDKSPPIGSIARTLSWEDSAVGPATQYPIKPLPAPLSPEEEEQECFVYVQTLLSAAGLDGEVRSDSFLARWHSPESPLDPSLREKYMNPGDKEPMVIHEAKRRQQRSIQKLVFDCVNEALVDLAGHGPCSGPHSKLEDMALSSTVLSDRIWVRMREWISGEERCAWGVDGGDGGSLVVERVVRKEVVGRGWMEHLRLENDNIRKEIEGKLLEELVQESVLELTGRV